MQAVHPLTFSDAYSLNPNPPPTGEVNPNPPSTGGVRGGHSVGAFLRITILLFITTLQ